MKIDIGDHDGTIQWGGTYYFALSELRSAARARGLPGAALAKEPRNAAGDTADYFDYVMFAWGNCVAGDRLVTERRLGRPPAEEEFLGAILPGVRFYFPYAALAAHPNRVYDGYHPVKIRDCLDLQEYLAACVIPSYLWAALSPWIPAALKNRGALPAL